MESIIIDRLLNGDSPETISEDLGLDLFYDPRVSESAMVIVPGYYADDGNAEIEFPYSDCGLEAAQEYVKDGDWGEVEKTFWVDVKVWRIGIFTEDGGIQQVPIEEESFTIPIDPNKPENCKGEWRSPYEVLGGLEENPGVWGKGGGVIIKEVCSCCGRYKITDTWAQNSNNGRQGLTSVEYLPPDEISLAWGQE
jgi:hypothetical protein